MKHTLPFWVLLILLLGCRQEAGIEPGEKEAIVTGYIIADYWSKGCSTGGLEIKVGDDNYVISNTIPSDYEDANAWPIPVWVRYESAPVDSCGHWTNWVTIRSIRKR